MELTNYTTPVLPWVDRATFDKIKDEAQELFPHNIKKLKTAAGKLANSASGIVGAVAGVPLINDIPSLEAFRATRKRSFDFNADRFETSLNEVRALLDAAEDEYKRLKSSL